MKLHEIEIDDESLAGICRRFKVRRLWFFGSVLRGDFRADSDIDVLVELFEPIGLFKLGGVQSELSGLLGRQAHITTLGAVPASYRQELLSSAALRYAA